ncbi:ribosomal protein S6 glutaminyl transferase [Gracilibacillus boraciitolerans JCM 21714]|uniref:Ribosomal protein S6 glutaminyl transferase n=1 Tax=Gracilibacillus boraciitolerans JCM 21714 TaxID=1298598 RepID=W4VNX9_9BACI|nr:ATP-grasp domain-containing protein [Gracilibacillus boraciitolerans]GAE94439.1 ribosomal protein S6 glutaminyl transferase [Gracilibacillus boraciitolerans JCM 21714]
MMKAWIVYQQEDAIRNRAYIEWFIKEAKMLQIELKLVLADQLQYGVKSNQLFLEWEQEDFLPDFIIMRAIDDLLSNQFEALDIPVYNTASVASITNDKAKTHQLLAQHDIPMVDTYFYNRSTLNKRSFRTFPIVIKEVAGRGGKQVFKINSNQELKEILEKLKGDRFIVQALAKPGKDLRVFVIGKKIIAAILRESSDDFRANYSLGGTARSYQLQQREKEIVEKIVEIFPFGMVGIDLIFDEEDRPLFNEIEDVVGSRTLSVQTNINIVRLYLQFIIADLNSY